MRKVSGSVPAIAGDNGYVMSLVLPRVRRRADRPNPWIPAFAGKTVWSMSLRSPIGVGDDGEWGLGTAGVWWVSAFGGTTVWGI